MSLLVQLGVVTRSEILNKWYHCYPLAGRNNLYAITYDGSDGSDGYVIKQFLEGEKPHLRYSAEKRFYTWIATLPKPAPTPRLIAHDDEAQLIVISYCAGTHLVSTLLGCSEASGIRTAKAILYGLREWYSCFHGDDVITISDLGDARPSILSGIDNFVESLVGTSVAQRQVAQAATQTSCLAELPQLCAALWKNDRIFHGDLKLSNVLIRHDGGLWFLDAELSGQGDLAWVWVPETRPW